MAVGTISLPISAAYFPDGSASNLAPALQNAKSSAGAPTPYLLQLVFDGGSNIEMVFWSFRMPADYASAPVLKAQFKMASATTGNVILECYVEAVSDGDSQDVDADGFGGGNVSAATAVPGTAGFLKEVSITLTNNDSLAAGDFVVLRFNRDPTNGSDTASGDLELISASLEYVST